MCVCVCVCVCVGCSLESGHKKNNSLPPFESGHQKRSNSLPSFKYLFSPDEHNIRIPITCPLPSLDNDPLI
jgi:hypothetical protein